MKRIHFFVIGLVVIAGLAAFAWHPISHFFADDACLDSGGAVGPDHTCRH